MNKLFDLDSAENKICKQYRKDIFKKIDQLSFSEKKNVLKKVDEEFLNYIENIDMSKPRRLDFMTHSDRFYLSVRLSYIDKVIKEVQKLNLQKKIQKRKSNIKLVWINNK
tara:strand:- start:291 stop:620 length:330 start_codon:yes stop_codon:yes gene_type:complete